MNSALKTISSYMAQEMISILRVDLRDDTVRVVKSSSSTRSIFENSVEKDYPFTKMIQDFIQAGGVYLDDIAMVLQETDIDLLRSRFEIVTEQNMSTVKYSFTYRRHVGNSYRTVIAKMVPTAYFTQAHPIIYMYIQDIDVDLPEQLTIPTSVDTSAGDSIEAAQQNQDDSNSVFLQSINALASIYMSMHIVDVVNNTVMQFSGSKNFESNIQPSSDAISQFQNIIRNNVEPRFRARAIAFTDLSTLSERMISNNTISAEVIGTTVGWFKMQFIVISRSSNGDIEKVFFTTQVIDSEKRKEEKLLKKSNTDELTGLYNRHAFENDILELKSHKLPSDLVILSVDINELKMVNDSLGHSAGDELICGTAEALIATIGHMGRVYRTGGDEFTVILFCERTMVDAVITDIKTNVASWHGLVNDSLSVSCGAVSASELPYAAFEDLISESDRRMYADKSRYYVESGKDRRKHS